MTLTFGPVYFVRQKVKTMEFSETIVVYDIKAGRYYQVCSNDDPVMTLTYFTARSNLVPYAFVWQKGKTMDFSETIVVYDIKVCRCSQLRT